MQELAGISTSIIRGHQQFNNTFFIEICYSTQCAPLNQFLEQSFIERHLWQIVAMLMHITGFVHQQPKQIPGLFHDFSRTYSRFSRMKNRKFAEDFHRNYMFISTLRSRAPGKFNRIKFSQEI